MTGTSLPNVLCFPHLRRLSQESEEVTANSYWKGQKSWWKRCSVKQAGLTRWIVLAKNSLFLLVWKCAFPRLFYTLLADSPELRVSQKPVWQSPCQSFGVNESWLFWTCQYFCAWACPPLNMAMRHSWISAEVLRLMSNLWTWTVEGEAWPLLCWQAGGTVSSFCDCSVLSVVKSYLLAGGFFEGRNLAHGYSRSCFQWVCYCKM